MEQTEQTGIQGQDKEFTLTTTRRGISWAKAECWQVQPSQVEEVWELIEPFIGEWLGVQDYALSLKEIKENLEKGLIQAFIVHACGDIGLVSLTQFVQYEHNKSLRFIGTAGHNPLLIKKFMPSVELWAKANGATFLETFAHPRIVKLDERLGFKTESVYMTKDLTEGE